MFKRFILYIEQAPWDEELERQEKSLERFCWFVIIMAAIFFIPVCLNSVLEAKHNEKQAIERTVSTASNLQIGTATNQADNVYQSTEHRTSQVRRLLEF
jgi:hypothetical protein